MSTLVDDLDVSYRDIGEAIDLDGGSASCFDAQAFDNLTIARGYDRSGILQCGGRAAFGGDCYQSQKTGEEARSDKSHGGQPQFIRPPQGALC